MSRRGRAEEPAAPPASSRMPRGDFRPETQVNPPPKFLPVGYREEAGRVLEAVMEAFRASGIVVEAIDRAGGLLRGSHDMGGGAVAVVTAAISSTDDGGSRLLLAYDRPPGTRMDPFADGKRLEELLARVDGALGA